jgi:hypothetical protein
MKMKKLALGMAVAAGVGSTSAWAVTESEYAVGLLVPNVIFKANGETTAVGIISRAKGRVYWTFFDENSNHVTDGQFDVTANDYNSFLWKDEAGLGLEDKRGYLLFVADVSSGNPPTCNNTQTDGLITACDAALSPIAGHAVQVLPPNDAAFAPAFPLANVDLSTFPITPTNLGPTDVDYLVAGANCVAAGNSITGTIGTLTESITGPYNDDIDMRYCIDNCAGGNATTNILVWSAQMIKGTYTVNMFDDKQNRKSVNFTLPNEEQNFLDPSKIPGRPANFTEGFIRWDVPCGFTDAQHRNPAPWNGVVSFSTISAPAFGAVQTIVNPFGPNVSP